MVENELGKFPGSMENVAPSDSHGSYNIQAVNKKRARFEMSPQTPMIADRATDAAKHSEVFILKESLKSERDTLFKLYMELEEERGASMTAANEAMAMITRLQEEKAAVLMEARRYQRVAEERETHNQEAISLLKDALMMKEDDLLALQDLLNAYRETAFRLESENRKHECKYLETDCEKEDLLYLEGPKSSLVTGMCLHDAKHIVDNSHEEVEYQHRFLGTKHNEWLTQDKNSAGSSVDFGGVFEQKSLEGASEERSEDTHSAWHRCQDNREGNDSISEFENDKHLCGRSLEDVSVSIFKRVKRLEERFEYLQQNQTLHNDAYNMFCEADAIFSDDLVPEELTRPDRGSSPKAFPNRNLYCSMESRRDVVGYVDDSCGEPKEVLKCLSFEGVKRALVNEDGQRQFSKSSGRVGFEQRQNRRAVDERLPSVQELVDDEPESVVDVYEVQIETTRPVVCPPEWDLHGDCGTDKCFMEGMDVQVLSKPHVSIKESSNRVPSMFGNQAEVCSDVVDKLSIEISSLDVKGIHTNVVDDDVQQLKVRLQALEGERVFMKDAIDSLRKENKELRVLQELAQQLRDLKGDVRQTRHMELARQHNHQSLLSFFKGILSFNDSQSSSPGEGIRSLWCSRSSPGTKEQGGLLHILDKAEKSVCVTRERKVNIRSPR